MSPARKDAALKTHPETEAVTTPLRTARTLRRKRAPKWTWQAVGAVAVVAVAGYLVYSAVKPATSTTRYVTSTVSRGTLTVSSSGNGNVIVGKASSVSPQVSGTVANLSVSVGEKVTAGQKLFDIVNDQLDAQVTQAQSQFKSAQSSVNKANLSATQADNQVSQDQANLAKAQDTLTQDQSQYDTLRLTKPVTDSQVQSLYYKLRDDKRQIALAKQKLSADQTNADNAEADVSTTVSQRTSAYDSYVLAQETAGKRTVTAPISGVITQLNVQNGDSIGGGSSSSSSSSSSRSGSSSSSSGGSSSAAMVISDMSTLEAQVSVSEVDRANIKIGQKATLTFDALPNLTSTGKVTQLDAVGTNSSGVVTYNVTIAFDSIDPKVSPGMTAAAAITTDVRTNVISVPRAAVKTDSSGGSYVLVMANGSTTPQQVTVETGASTDSATEITSGLKEGDVVVTQSITPNSSSGTSSGGSGNRGFGGFGGGMGGGGVRIRTGG